VADSIIAHTIDIRFTVSNGSALADTFFISGNGGRDFQGVTAQLFDGKNLLGTTTGTSTNPFFVWASSSSVFTLGSPTVIDFSSFQNGTINGLIVITSSTALQIPSLTNFFVGFDLHATGSSSGSEVAGVNITSVTVVPEPSNLILVGTGFLAVMGAARKKLGG
jgi:PEP-CTERM motif